MSMVAQAVEVSAPAMHIPDGFLSPAVAAAGWVVTAVAVGYAARRANKQLDERAVPLMGVMAAFIFAAQMINFPVAGGTSGHLLGGTLAAVLLGGPWLAIVVMAAVISLQALLFQDGGLVALGANIANMGIITALVGWGIYSLLGALTRGRSGPSLAVAFLAAWVSVQVAALATSLELAVSGTSELSVVLPAMLGVHVLIGLGEGAITAAALAFVVSTRPELVARFAPARNEAAQ